MGTEIILPPGYSIRIDYDPDKAPVSLTVAVFRDGRWIGAANVSPRAAREGQLQEVVDLLTERRVRPMREAATRSEAHR
jgi:hypothetical protein